MLNAATRIIRAFVFLAFAGATLAACGQNSGGAPEASGGQIVARVGKEVVTVPELDNEMRLLNVPADKRKDPELLKRVLTELVTRKYVVQQALAAKLDREPTVLLDILRSREQVVANAFVTRDVTAKAAALTKSDIDKYIANNPLKFANRQILNVEQITFPLGPNAQAVADATKDMKSIDEVDQKLTQMNVLHARSSGALNSGDISEELFKAMQSKKADDIFFVRSGPNGVFIKVKNEEGRPLDGEGAANLARQMLRIDLLKTEATIATASASAEAKFEGEYAKIMGKQDPAADGKK